MRAAWLNRVRTLTIFSCLIAKSSPRPLPHKNELANACYFTYRVGYVICDDGLNPEEAQEAMGQGKCNEDFRLVGSDFQRLAVRHYSHGGRPPLEEVMWLLTSPDNFQNRTLQECAPMQVISYTLMAEAQLYIDGPSTSGYAAELLFTALEQGKSVEQDVLNSLGRAWPIDLAMDRFQAKLLDLRKLAAARGWNAEKRQLLETQSKDGQSESASPFAVHIVICRCGGQSLDWLAELVPPALPATFLIYEACDGDPHDGLEALRRAGSGSPNLQQQAAAGSADTSRGECSAEGVLWHVNLFAEAAPAFTAFLPAEPPGEQEQQFLRLVLQSLAQRTLDTEYLALGWQRVAPKRASACQSSIFYEHFGLKSHPMGYSGSRFIVDASRFREAVAPSRKLLSMIEDPPATCKGGDAAAEPASMVAEAVASAWHVLFGESAHLPIRSDDSRLPAFLRPEDGQSGFSGTKMPKSSEYLTRAHRGTFAL
eukprot:TRINITY_DN35199_c0_g1_i1.p1 TRINITY_DN35199_c0_g1~~TRINITY_DN35199_c0_g1_i1.p1  ORF type:complete len:482 (-),score=107.64 TRINITY_DN35199_c0_g1_i1:475-1920(-)